MTRYRAEFSNGNVRDIANSRRQYTHAWHWTGRTDKGQIVGECGFAASAALANKAMHASQGYIRKGSVLYGVRYSNPGEILFEQIVEAQAS